MTQTGITLQLIGQDGNAYMILGLAKKALKDNGKADLVEAFMAEATAGDYNHLLVTAMEWFEIE